MKKVYVTIEHTDGTVRDALRVHAADKIRASQIARTNSIPWEEGPQTHALLAYAAERRALATDAPDFDAWLDTVIDFELSNEAPAGDPTAPTTP